MYKRITVKNAILFQPITIQTGYANNCIKPPKSTANERLASVLNNFIPKLNWNRYCIIKSFPIPIPSGITVTADILCIGVLCYSVVLGGKNDNKQIQFNLHYPKIESVCKHRDTYTHHSCFGLLPSFLTVFCSCSCHQRPEWECLFWGCLAMVQTSLKVTHSYWYFCAHEVYARQSETGLLLEKNIQSNIHI